MSHGQLRTNGDRVLLERLIMTIVLRCGVHFTMLAMITII